MAELNPVQFEGSIRDYEGTPGRSDHITRVMEGTLPTAAVAHLKGAAGELPGQHRSRQGERWESFVNDVRANGVKKPIFITVDPGGATKLSEGNHRRDAALEAGHPRIPVHVQYFGHAERD